MVDVAHLRALSALYPDSDAVLARIAQLSAQLTLPKGTVHIVSDVHGEHKKLKHIINNASGTLRVLVDAELGEQLASNEKLELLNLIYYPRETWAHRIAKLELDERRLAVETFLRRATTLLRALARRYTLDQVDAVLPPAHRWMFHELLLERELARERDFIGAIIERFFVHHQELELVRLFAHAVRNLLASELIVAGDLGDRGPRLDKVLDHLIRQPNVSFTWGNHDVVWMAACLGEPTSIATVIRSSLRYRRLSQLEEGYGIPMIPVEKLAQTVYGDDPAECFRVKGEGLRAPVLMARMQKAMAVIQFKLEGQIAERNPDLKLRNVLRGVDPQKKTVTLEGGEYPLLDSSFPTIDWSDPLRLSTEEERCLSRLSESFLLSPTLWRHMRWVMERGSTYLIRDDNLIFHGCVPVDSAGRFLSVNIDGIDRSGRALFDALALVVRRAFQNKAQRDLDLVFWGWSGVRSPLFGKDKMTTFERYLVADKAAHQETKNPYFKMIHEPDFCRRIFHEFGIATDTGLIINGHVPVKVEAGETPLKKSGMAVTIDGAFSEAYGDRGYTLVLEADRSYVAEHHHFESAAAAVQTGADIVPTIEVVRAHAWHRRTADTEEGARIRAEIAVLEQLLSARGSGLLR